jgi:hypothetical protein
MEELQTINEIVSNSVRDSSYITVIISSSVFIIYTLIIRLVDFFKSKHKDKPLLEMSKAMQEMGNNIAKLNTVLSKTFDDAEKREVRQADRAIQLAFKAMAFKISQECANIIVHNNIDKNKELISSNINKIISTEYNKLYSALSVYEIREVNVASKLKEEWIKEIANTLITIIYDGQDAVTRIVHINDRISILTNDYSIYISNKIFNT